MTIRINSATEALYINTGVETPITFGSLEIQSQWSKKRELFSATRTLQNERYTVYSVNFGDDFKDTHKNGVYWARLTAPGFTEGTWFLLKIITEPGGGDGMTRYEADADTEARVADTYYRPNY